MSAPATAGRATPAPTGQAIFRARAVLLDLDGTLLDTVADLAAAVDAMLVELGRAPVGESAVRTWVGKGARVLVRRALAGSLDAPFDDASVDAAMPVFERHYARENGASARLYPNAVDGLVAMRAKGLALACVTNKPQSFSDALLERTGLAAHFAVVVGADPRLARKPDPAPLLHACERLGVAPARAVAIGDSMNDVQAAHAAGMPVIVVPYGYNEGRPASSLDADAHVDDLLQACARIEML
ncbi:MAG: phosphoglycolate phosphatase [Burkholderiaceae bacterium]|nr:phosphoglycolate phosphatase [Burkholderiaceae bacterium]